MNPITIPHTVREAVPGTVVDALLALELAADDLRDMREHAERTVREIEERMAANSAAYFEGKRA